MPKKTLGFCGAICALLCATPAEAATCAPGYYLSGGSCLQCNPGNEPFYCPGDDVRHSCPRTGTNYEKYGYTFIRGGEAVWAGGQPTASVSGACMCDIYLQDAHGNEFLLENAFNGTDYWGDRRWWCKAGAGYYLSRYSWTSEHNWYSGIQPCTNVPAHAHYTGPGTPDSPDGTVTDANDCPWECDNGYGRVGDTCEPLCAIGITHIRAGATTAPLFPVKYTSPALVIRTAGGTCYGNLTSGNGTGINIRLGGVTYTIK